MRTTVGLIFVVVAVALAGVQARPQEDGSLDDIIDQLFTKTPPSGGNQQGGGNVVTPVPNQGGGVVTLSPPVTQAPVRPVQPVGPGPVQPEPPAQICEGGECVPYYLCSANGTVITDGDGLIDIRIDVEDEVRQCADYIEKCCAMDNRQTTPIIPPSTIKAGCGHRNPDGIGFRISGDRNNEAQYGEFPWMVAVLKEERGLDQILNVYQCGGSLIHPQVVLTAAHCVAGKVPTTLKIRAGEWDTQTKNEIWPHQDRPVREFVIHEQYYKGALFNDVALLFLESPVELVDNVQTVCLPPQGVTFDHTRCYASGWGKDVFGKEGKYQVILKKIDLPIVPRNQCQESLRSTRLGKHFELHNSFICAGGEQGKDTCKGDGGSPLVCPVQGTKDQYYQTGIVAWGIGCGENLVPGVYANVAMFRDWIDGKMHGHQLDTSYYGQI